MSFIAKSYTLCFALVNEHFGSYCGFGEGRGGMVRGGVKTIMEKLTTRPFILVNRTNNNFAA